ncbi:CRISPR-associated helicase Cas3' [bacterium]|nr:CRISPR-associated helicase Cas3' [bacterium]
MYSSIDSQSFAQIINHLGKVSDHIVDNKTYWAHRDKFERKPEETLDDHIQLVMESFKRLLHVHGLESVLDSLISKIVETSYSELTIGNVAAFIKHSFALAIFAHDFGKVNVNFQADPDKMGNPHFALRKGVLGTTHSPLSTYIFIVERLQEAQKIVTHGELLTLSKLVMGLAFSIYKHHSSAFNDDVEEKLSIKDEMLAEMREYLSLFNIKEQRSLVEGYQKTIENIFKQFQAKDSLFPIELSFPIYNLVRLNFSLLTAADYLATGQYMSGLKIQDFGVLSKERKAELIENVQKTKDYNTTVFKELDGFKFTNPKERSGKNLNTLRKEMAVEVLQNVRANTDKNLFYLEAPTGGGKTNLSMLATAELLKADERLNKVFYVFPFTTLITQTYSAIKEVFWLRDDEVIELHAKTGIKAKEQEEAEDGVYGNKKKQYVDHLLLHYPFCLLTHIRFFDIIKTNRKEANYLLHRLANSVVVIDELQSYNPSHWDKLVYFIQQYAKHYNIKFILMSATLPRIDELKVKGIEQNVFTSLIPDAKRKYFQNPNFGSRVTFDLTTIQSLPNNTNEAYKVIAERLIEESLKYAEFVSKDPKDKPKGSVYTIIEFIFKKSATEFYKLIEKLDHPFDEVFVLSGTILEHRRKHIINFLKNEENRKKKVLLITTQVVEAGVDIDMDLGFKNISLIDSDEQLAGRINRNVNKENCKLFLFEINQPGKIYDRDIRYQETIKFLRENPKTHKRILEEKDFGYLYDLVVKNIEKWNETNFAKGKLSEYLDDIKNLRFDSVNEKFKLIDQDNLSVFVPLAIPIEQNGEKIFDKSECDLLRKNDLFAHDVDGVKVFDFYLSLLDGEKGDFIEDKIRMKTLRSIMSKFTISLFANPKTETALIEFSNTEKSQFGFIYLEHWEKVYDEFKGLDESQFENVENQFL